MTLKKNFNYLPGRNRDRRSSQKLGDVAATGHRPEGRGDGVADQGQDQRDDGQAQPRNAQEERGRHEEDGERV